MNKTAIIIGNGKTTKYLLDYGFNNISSNIDTYTTSLAYRYCEEIDWWSDFYCFFDPKSVDYHHDKLEYHINNKKNPVKKWYLFSFKKNFKDNHNKIDYVEWSASGNGALKLAIKKNQYNKIILIGLDNDYTWDDEMVERVDNNTNKRRYRKNIENHPDYFYTNYIRKGDIVSWDSGRKITENDGRENDLVNQIKNAKDKNITILNFSKNGNINIEELKNNL